MEPPRWAWNLVQKLCAEHRVGLPTVLWSQRRRRTLGWYCHIYAPFEVSIVEGRDRIDARLTLVHEMGHYIRLQKNAADGGEHDEAFYAFLWQLYRRHRVPIRYALKIEGRYRKDSVKAYRTLGGRL